MTRILRRRSRRAVSARCGALAVALAILLTGLTGCTTTPAQTAAPAPLQELARQSLARIDGNLAVAGLKEPVEVLRDEWGIPHIYTRNTHDLFFA